MALPQEAVYNQLKPSVAAAEGRTARLFPEAGTSFTGGQIINFSLPAGRSGEYLRGTETSLFLKIKNTGAAASNANDAHFDGGAWSIIQKISIFHGATLLSEIEDYNALHNLMYDMTASSNYRQSVGSLIHGTADVGPGSSTAETLKGATITENGGEYNAAIQIISPLIGTTSEKMLPLGLMSADLRVSITLAADAAAFMFSGTPVITYSDVELHTQIVQMDPSVDAAIASDPSGVLSFHSTDFRTYTHSIASGTTFDVVQLPMRFSSLNYALHVFRPSSNLSASAKRAVSGRTKNKLTKAQYRLGSQLVPQRPVDISNSNMAGAVVELLKTQGKLESLGDDFGLIFADTALFTNDDTTGSSLQGSFALGIDLTPFSGSLDDLSNGGINSLSTPIALEMSFGTTTYDARLTTYANYSTMLVLDLNTGLLSVRF